MIMTGRTSTTYVRVCISHNCSTHAHLAATSLFIGTVTKEQGVERLLKLCTLGKEIVAIILEN